MPFNVFGGGAVQSAYVSYLKIDLTQPPLGNVYLVWPTSYVDAPYRSGGVNYNVLAASMEVMTGAGNAYFIKLPKATESSVGQNFIISNIGIDPFTLFYEDGTTQLLDVLNGHVYWIQLTDNTTANGVWKIVHFGVGESNADAAALVGDGLIVLNDRLNTNISVQSKNANYTVVVGDRAKLIVCKAGTGTVTLPAINTIPAGFYVSLNNELGIGLQLTIQSTGGTNINGSPPPFLIGNHQSLTLITDGTEWWVLGFNQNTTSASTIAPYILKTTDANLPNSFAIGNLQTGLLKNTTVTGIPTIAVRGVDYYGPGLVIPIGGGGTGQTTALAAFKALAPAATTGSVLCFNGTDWVILAPAANNTQLTSNGLNTMPSWR